MTASVDGVSFGGNENILELVMMVAQLCEHIKNHQCVHIKRMNFTAQEFSEVYPNETISKKILRPCPRTIKSKWGT